MRTRALFLIAALSGTAVAGVFLFRPQPPLERRSAGPVTSGVRGATSAARPTGPDDGIPPVGPAWFSEVLPEKSGITFVHDSGDSAEKPFPAANGSGVAALDLDLDGRCDLYFATGTPFPIDPARISPTNRCYRCLGGWRFADVTEPCGLGHNGYSAGLAVGDFDSDGFPDIYVACYGEDVLYRGFGDGTFEPVDRVGRAGDTGWATSAAFLDYDADGLLDIYVCNYGKWSLETNRFCGDRERNVRLFCSPRSVEPQPGVLYRNAGDGTFEETTEAAGLSKRVARAQGVVCGDFNDDGRTDIYVGNDLHPNSLFVNRGDGTFDDASEFSGAAYDFQGVMQAGMGVDAADTDGDGDSDLFVTNFEGEYNTLYENRGGGSFQDVSHSRGLAAESIPWIGWGTRFADFDLDGWPDLVVTNGHVDDNRHLLGQSSPHAQPALAYRNVSGRFEFVGPAAGPYFSGRHVGRALALADLDGDGDQDLVIGHQDDRPGLLRNESRGSMMAPNPGGRHSTEKPCVVLRLAGVRSNRDAVGSTLTFRSGDRVLVQQIKGGGSYLSAHDLRQTFAVRPGEAEIACDVLWPSGGRSRIPGLEPGKEYVVTEPRDPSEDPSILSLELTDGE